MNKRRYAKKKYGKKRKYNKGSSVTSLTLRSPTILPDRLFLKFKYFGEYKITGSSNNIAFRGNCPYDPEEGLGGHSVMGWDQWSTLYANYRVHASSIFARVASISHPVRISVTPTTVARNPNLVNVAIERPYTKYKTIASSINVDNFVFNSMTTKRIFGLKNIRDDDFMGQEMTKIPLAEWWWQFCLGVYDNVTTATSFVDVTLTYFVELTNRRELTPSGLSGTLDDGPTGYIGGNPHDIPSYSGSLTGPLGIEIFTGPQGEIGS